MKSSTLNFARATACNYRGVASFLLFVGLADFHFHIYWKLHAWLVRIRVYHFIFCTFTFFGNFLSNTTLAISSFFFLTKRVKFPANFSGATKTAELPRLLLSFFEQLSASTERKLNFKLQKQCLRPPYRVHNSPHFSLTQSLTFLEPPSLEQRKLCDSPIASYKSCFCVVLC